MSTPAIRALRRSFPEAHIALIGHQRHRSLLALNPHIDQLLTYRGKAKSFRPLVKELRAGQFDVGVVLHGNDPETIPLLWAGKVKYIVADAKTRLGFLLSRQIPIFSNDEHMARHRLKVAQSIGAKPHGFAWEQPIDEATSTWARQFIDAHFGATHPVVALAPGASGAYKRWPIERFAVLGRRLQEKHGAGILILTNSKETDLADHIGAQLTDPWWATNGRVSLLEVAGLIQASQLVVANDSGLFHLSLAVKTPALVLMGAEGPKSYGPIEAEAAETIFIRPEVCPRQACLRQRCPDPICLSSIPVEAVLERLAKRFGDILTRG